MRLNKYLARCGVTSRRKADDLIADGRVAVNGKTVTELGTKVEPDAATVTVDGEAVELPDKYICYLLHKPQKSISTVDDPKGRPTVVDLIDTERRIYPVGRLDYDTTGVLLLTDDGELANKLTHPSNEVPRKYEVYYSGKLPEDARGKLAEGIDIGEDLPASGELQILWEKEDHGATHLTLHAGRYHEVKRIFKHFGCSIERLHRIKFAGLDCGELAPGEYRRLSSDELQQLKTGE
ncbi:MAG: rRNA pseudouridine synthase [Candidatus Marinimicrobia bacterium]|nr:rRNA pseudouridine synthase [Candidatus Neomarinimicrobiota bacterium]MCF7828573.1 rRNA pseudouridine synthase [Candidatus Neomarinimicrobiota bacterium]MCF7880314.1 rRNA pseudouridine synthase [Candidatus Neomarinimicrobiota bacterium]